MGPEYKKLVEPKISVATPGDGEGAWPAGFGGGVGGVEAVDVTVLVEERVLVTVGVDDADADAVEVDDDVVASVVVDVRVAVFVDEVVAVPLGACVGVATVLFAPDGI